MIPERATPTPHRAQLGLVLAGGAARGAYQVGALSYMAEEVSRTLGYDIPLDILSGTSVGAINAVSMAAFADEPRGRVARLRSVWTNLRVEDVLRPIAGGAVDLLRGLLGRHVEQTSSLFDPSALQGLLTDSIPFEQIDRHLREGRIRAVTVSATQVATGRTVVFVQRRHARPDPWTGTTLVVPRAVRLRTSHVLASAAVPLLFPAVELHGRYYCDGGLRQNIPLSPARRLGATHILVINPRHATGAGRSAAIEAEREEYFPNPLFLLGKALNALLLDRIDNEIDRLEKINAILEAGTRSYGDAFSETLSRELGYPAGSGLRRVRIVHLRASENIGAMCADFVRSPKFRVGGVLGRVMRRLAEGESRREADLLTYLLFDGAFAEQLIELGRDDARRHHDALCALFDEVLRERAAGR
ncbi:MAG: patatin-like phospholipase family protein [Myxococcota bacterium]